MPSARQKVLKEFRPVWYVDSVSVECRRRSRSEASWPTVSVPSQAAYGTVRWAVAVVRAGDIVVIECRTGPGGRATERAPQAGALGAVEVQLLGPSAASSGGQPENGHAPACAYEPSGPFARVQEQPRPGLVGVHC